MNTEIKARIESYEVQPNGNVKISSLMKLLQKIAGDDLDNKNLSYMALRDHNIAFVLTKVTLQMYEDIKLYDNITIRTYPRKLRGATFLRDFIIIGADGKKAAYATSSWVLIDLEKRSILRPSALDEIGEIPTSDAELSTLPDVRRKVDSTSLPKTNVRTVRYSQLDMNEHLNNTYYADFIFDIIPPELHPSDANMFFEINYKTEARLGEELYMYISMPISREIDFFAQKDGSDKPCFSAYINFDGSDRISQ